MESFLSLFVFNSTSVVSFLVIAITVIVVFLLVFNQKSPESVVRSEIDGHDNVEGALRRVLGEQRWAQNASASGDGASPEALQELEKEVLAKDRTIADLNKQLTQSGGTAGESTLSPSSPAEQDELMNRISELEGRLEEYEIIEDDIADLSLYKAENDKLKEELQRLKASAGVAGPIAAETDSAVEEAPAAEPLQTPEKVEKNESGAAADLVAEFEKVVNSQEEAAADLKPTKVVENNQPATGKVNVDDHFIKPEAVTMAPVEVHEKLADISPNSKEEAEVFITELKSLKKGS